MPELPEVETMVRGVRDVVEGSKLVDVRACPCHCRPIQVDPDLKEMRRLTRGLRVDAVSRLGKRVVFELEDGRSFVIEPRMSGLVLLGDAPSQDHLRVEWRLSAGRATRSVWFWDRRGLGTVSLVSPEERDERWGPSRLGPDALCISAVELHSRTSATHRPIKVALLDQKLIAGIGNLYASEILHRAHVHPEQPASRLKRKTVDRILESTRAVLLEAIQYEGSTLGDGTYRNALNQSGQYQNAHRVYGREAEVCPSCRRGRIRRIVQAQRSTFYCPSCQRRPPSRS